MRVPVGTEVEAVKEIDSHRLLIRLPNGFEGVFSKGCLTNPAAPKGETLAKFKELVEGFRKRRPKQFFDYINQPMNAGDGLVSDPPNKSGIFRDHVIQWSKDLGRSIDYLETRNDIDIDKLAYYGWSWGGARGGLLPALEERLKVCVLAVGGFWRQRGRPEVEQINFAPRIIVSVLTRISSLKS